MSRLNEASPLQVPTTFYELYMYQSFRKPSIEIGFEQVVQLDQNSASMSDENPNFQFNDSAAVAISGKIMVGSILVLFLVVVFVFMLHFLAKSYWARRIESGSQRRRFVFASSPREVRSRNQQLGLKPSVIQSLPLVVFTSDKFVDGLECAVCLSELSDGEKARLLPNCNHGFHVDCIDMWFHSHSTCPLCRNPVVPESSNPISTLPREEIRIPISTTSDHSSSTESFPFTTSTLFWGNRNQVSSSGSSPEDGPSSSSTTTTTAPPAIGRQGKETLAIDIPPRLNEGFSSLSPSTGDYKSPMTRQLRSLKRMLSKERKVFPCSPRSIVDVEQGQTEKASASDS